jgi:hypothetical protein
MGNGRATRDPGTSRGLLVNRNQTSRLKQTLVFEGD